MANRKAKTELPQEREIQAIGLQIGKEEYAINIGEIQEIIPTPRITRVPKAPDHILGVINLRGNVIPVIDLARRLGIGHTELTELSRIVAVEVENELVGILAERVSKVSKLLESQIKPPPPLVSGISGEYLDGVSKLDNRFLIFVNISRTLAELNSPSANEPEA